MRREPCFLANKSDSACTSKGKNEELASLKALQRWMYASFDSEMSDRHASSEAERVVES